MSNTNPTEERLFVLLDTVEKLTEQTAQQQRAVAELTKKLDDKTRSFDESIDKKLATAEREIDMSQTRFDHIVYTSTKHLIERNLPTLLNNVIKEQANFVPFDNALDDAVRSLNKRINEGGTMYHVLHDMNIQKTQEVSDALDYHKESLAKEHYKLIAIVSTGLFLIMCVFFTIIYFVTVPTESRLEELRAQQAQLVANINQLKRNQQDWIRDAREKGYMKR